MRWLVFALTCVALAACAADDPIPDGDWELVRLEYDGRVYDEPLVLSSSDERMGGRGACNSFGQDDDGLISMTQVGCGPGPERVDEALIDAVEGSRRLEGDELVLEGSFAVAVLRSIEIPAPEELFSILASNRPDADPFTLILDSEAGGPPQDWDRMIRLEDDLDVIEFVIGSSGRSVCFHVGVDTARPTSGSSCRPVVDIRSEAMTMVAGFPVPKVGAALIPDSFLTEANVAALDAVGTINGNLFVADGDASVELVLVDEGGGQYSVSIPRFEDLAG